MIEEMSMTMRRTSEITKDSSGTLFAEASTSSSNGNSALAASAVDSDITEEDHLMIMQ